MDLLSQQEVDDDQWLNNRQPDCITKIAQYTDDIAGYLDDKNTAAAKRDAAQLALAVASADANEKEGEIVAIEGDITAFGDVWSSDTFNSE